MAMLDSPLEWHAIRAQFGSSNGNGAMPNGRSGAFWIPKTQFEMLLDALPRDREVGVLGMMNATAAKVKRVLAQQNSQNAKLSVEEQDGQEPLSVEPQQ